MAGNITMLGTGGDSIVVGRQLRASGGILITTPQNQVHLDPGPGTLIQLKKNEYHPRETTAILLSHQHVSHASEAAALISAMTHNGIDKRGILISNTLDECLVPRYQLSLLDKSLALRPENKIGINDVEVRAVPLRHYDSDAVGYLLQTPHYLLGYITDTKYFEGLTKDYKDCNILIINCKYPDDKAEGDHLCTEDVMALLKGVKPQLAVITHFGIKMLDADPLAQARMIHRETGVQVVAAKDGLHIAPSHYDAQQKQQKLKRF